MQGIAQKILANPGKYSIQELQQGVEHGVIPAYIAVPLIQEKVQQQKQMVMAQAMQQPPAQQQPSIASQVMSEARGLEGMPTNLPQQYAMGGIVAFEQGGPVERYQNTGLVQPFGGILGQFIQPTLTQAEQDRVRRLQQEAQMRAAGRSPSALTDADLDAAAKSFEGTRSVSGAPTAPTVKPPVDQGLGITGVPGAMARPTLQMPEGPTYEQMASDYFKQYGTEAAARDVETEKAKAAARDKVKGLAFDDYKKSLEQEALDAGAERSQAKYMSLFKAGLAMMAGTSRHALENIGKGALVGAEDYQAAVKDLKKADKERMKELAHIEQARRAESLGDRDMAIKEADAARDRADARARYTGEGIYKATGMDKAQAFDLAKTQFSSDSDIFRTNLAGQWGVAAANARVQGLLGSAGGKGGFTAEQMSKLIDEMRQHPDFTNYRKTLIEQKGKKAENTPEFQSALNKKLMELVNRRVADVGSIRSGTPLAGAQPNPDLQKLLADPAIQRYLASE